MATPSFAKMLECERYRTSGERYYAPGAYDSWFPREISLSSRKFKAIPGKKSISFHQNANFADSTSDVKVEFKLLPTGVLIKSSARLEGSARYKCNMKPEEVLAAQTSQTPSPPVNTSSTSSTTSTPSKADNAKAFCKDIGFTAGTEKFGECVLKMMDK
jgi:hypothetical protein